MVRLTKRSQFFVDAYGLSVRGRRANVVLHGGISGWLFCGIIIGFVSLDTLRRFLILSISSRAAGAADLSPCFFLPPAGLNRIEAKHWARWMARPFT
jgi:hypothetical protein